MTWQQWVLVTLYATSALIGIACIGKPREPKTPGEAIFGCVFCAGLIWLVVSI